MMPERKSIVQNLRWLAAANFAVKPLWFAFLLVSTRMLGPEEFGRFMYALSYVGLIAYLLEGGVDTLALRELSAHPGKYPRFFGDTTFLKAGWGFLIAVLAALSVNLLDIAGGTRTLIFVGVVYAVSSALLVHFRIVFRAFEVMQFEAGSILLEKGGVVLLCGIALALSRSAEPFMIAFASAYVLTAAVTFVVVVAKIGMPHWNLDPRRLWTTVIRPALPFALLGMMMVIYFRAATLLLQWFTGSDLQVGYFSAGYRLVEAFVLLPSIVVMPLFPTFARSRDDKTAARRLLAQAARGLGALSMIIAWPLLLFHEEFSLLLYGPAFAPGAPVMGVVVLSIVPFGLMWLYANLAGAIGRQGRLNVWILAITAADVALNVILIPRYGALGAAIATLVSGVGLALSTMWVVRDYLEKRDVVFLAFGLLLPPLTAMLLEGTHVVPGPFAIRLLVVLAILGGGFLLTGVLRFSEIRRLLFRQSGH